MRMERSGPSSWGLGGADTFALQWSQSNQLPRKMPEGLTAPVKCQKEARSSSEEGGCSHALLRDGVRWCHARAAGSWHLKGLAAPRSPPGTISPENTSSPLGRASPRAQGTGATETAGRRGLSKKIHPLSPWPLSQSPGFPGQRRGPGEMGELGPTREHGGWLPGADTDTVSGESRPGGKSTCIP